MVKSQGVVKHSQKEGKIKQRLKHVPLDALLQQGNQRLRMRLRLMNQRNPIYWYPTHTTHTHTNTSMIQKRDRRHNEHRLGKNGTLMRWSNANIVVPTRIVVACCVVVLYKGFLTQGLRRMHTHTHTTHTTHYSHYRTQHTPEKDQHQVPPVDRIQQQRHPCRRRTSQHRQQHRYRYRYHLRPPQWGSRPLMRTAAATR